MIKNEKEIKDLACVYARDEYMDYALSNIRDAYSAGFKKCEEMMMAECSECFYTWKKNYLKELLGDSEYPGTILANMPETLMEEAYQAGKLSSLKEIEDLKKVNDDQCYGFAETIRRETSRLTAENIMFKQEIEDLKTKLAQVEAVNAKYAGFFGGNNFMIRESELIDMVSTARGK